MHCAILLWLERRPLLGIDMFACFVDSAASNVRLSFSYMDFKKKHSGFLFKTLFGFTICQIALVYTDVCIIQTVWLRKAEDCYLHSGMLFFKMHYAILLRLGRRPFLYVYLRFCVFDSLCSNVRFVIFLNVD